MFETLIEIERNAVTKEGVFMYLVFVTRYFEELFGVRFNLSYRRLWRRYDFKHHPISVREHIREQLIHILILYLKDYNVELFTDSSSLAEFGFFKAYCEGYVFLIVPSGYVSERMLAMNNVITEHSLTGLYTLFILANGLDSDTDLLNYEELPLAFFYEILVKAKEGY